MRNALPAASLLLSLVLCFLLCLPATCSLADIYRYTDERGTVVLSRQGVPPQFAGKGYQILNESGRVIKVVPRAPTVEEIQQQQAEQERRARDERLLRLYSSPEDIARAKQRKLAELDKVIEKIGNQLSPINAKLVELYEQLAESRKDRTQAADNAPLALEISELKTEQRRLQTLIVQYKAQRRRTEEEFNAEQARFIELLSASSSS